MQTLLMVIMVTYLDDFLATLDCIQNYTANIAIQEEREAYTDTTYWPI